MSEVPILRRIVQALLLVIAVAVAARVIFGLLGPLLPTIAVLAIGMAIASVILRGPRTR
jgi:hypothetical protein